MKELKSGPEVAIFPPGYGSRDEVGIGGRMSNRCYSQKFNAQENTYYSSKPITHIPHRTHNSESYNSLTNQ